MTTENCIGTSGRGHVRPNLGPVAVDRRERARDGHEGSRALFITPDAKSLCMLP